jgi:hypothetical protein
MHASTVLIKFCFTNFYENESRSVMSEEDMHEFAKDSEQKIEISNMSSSDRQVPPASPGPIISSRILDLETQLSASETNARQLKDEVLSLTQQLKKMSERELEARARADTQEELMERFFDKMLAKMN